MHGTISRWHWWERKERGREKEEERKGGRVSRRWKWRRRERAAVRDVCMIIVIRVLFLVKMRTPL